MKEKIKNFLLKIKDFFYMERSFKLIELIVLFIIINIITMAFSYYDMRSNDYCFNETHITQVENVEIEKNIIERDLKGANPTQNDYINPSVQYNYIYVNSSLSPTEFGLLMGQLTFIDVSSLGVDNPIYPVYLTYSKSTSSSNVLWIEKRSDNTFALVSAFIPSTEFNYLGLFVAGSNGENFFPQIFYSPYSYVTTDFNGIPIGSQNQLLFNLFSSIPFESSSTPILDKAPSSLVNTLPTNALTTVPSNLGTLVYDTGSNFVGLPNGSNANILGVQIYYKSSWNQTTTDTYVEYEGINYSYNKPTPTITLSEVNVLIYTLWDDSPIYYNVGNVLDTPLTNYAVTSFEFFNWFNMFYSKVNVVNEYSDYWHLDFDIDYQVEYENRVTAEYDNVISYTDNGFEFLIPHNVSLVDIGYKSFDIEKFIELDSNYTDAYLWIGEQTSTNFVNQVFDRLYDNAYEEGDSDGFARGFDLNGDALENATNPILNFINKGASIISNVLNVEVLPHITLGTIFLFPLVIAMIWFVIKLFMGG